MSRRIQAIGFDWDGTLVDSVSVKANAFAETLLSCYQSINASYDTLAKLYISIRGKPRSEQFTNALQMFADITPTDIEMAKMDRFFVDIYAPQVPPLFPDTLPTLAELKERGYFLFVSSGMPEKDLFYVKSFYAIDHIFSHFLGRKDGFKKGIQHFSYMARCLGIEVSSILYIGDAVEDVKAAISAQATPVLRIDRRLPVDYTDLNVTKVDTLDQLLNYLDFHG